MRSSLLVTSSVATLSLLACRRPTAPPARDAAATPRAVADVPRDVGAPADRPHVTRRITPPPGIVARDAGVGRRTTTARVTGYSAEDPSALAASPTGALWVRAVNHPGQRVSEIVATVIDRDGNPVAPPKLLRRTTGPVRAVSVDAAGPHVWVAWHTVRGGEPDPDADDDGPRPREEHFVAAMHGNADLSEVGAPVTVATFSRPNLGDDQPYVWPAATARVFVRDDGGALLVSTGPRATCVHGESEEETERVPCEGWNVSRVEVSGAKRSSLETMLCPTDAPEGFVRVPGGIAYGVPDDHIGSKLVVFTASLGAESSAVTTPFDSELWHYRDAAMAWGDGVFAMMGAFTESTSSDAQPLGVFVRGPTPASRTPTLHDPFGGEVLPEFHAPPLRCEGGHPVLRVRWPDGGAGVTFDPTHPGTSVDLAAWIDFRSLPMPPHAEVPPAALVWAGAALVGVADGALLRWTCSPAGALRLAPSRAP